MPNAIGPQNTVTNIGAAERIGSTLAGAGPVFRALARPSFCRVALALGGMVLLQRGLTGRSALYAAFGADRAQRGGAEFDAVERLRRQLPGERSAVLDPGHRRRGPALEFDGDWVAGCSLDGTSRCLISGRRGGSGRPSGRGSA